MSSETTTIASRMLFPYPNRSQPRFLSWSVLVTSFLNVAPSDLDVKMHFHHGGCGIPTLEECLEMVLMVDYAKLGTS
jgi:hypothetical protein